MCLNYASHSRLNDEHDRGGGDLFDHLMSTRIFFPVMNEEHSHKLQKLLHNWLREQFGFANHLALIMCCISYEKWVLRGKVIT